MKMIVLVKQVPNTSEIKIDKETNTLIRKGVSSIINPDDLAGVEEALKLKEKYGGSVITVTMGPLDAESMIRELYGLGVDHAYLISDGKFAGSDTYATSSIISAFLKTLDYDLIIAGYQAIDGDTAQVGPQVAEFLDIPQVTHLHAIGDWNQKMNRLIVEKTEEDAIATYEVELPCLITTVRSMNSPRFMNAWDIWGSDDKKFALVKAGDFPLDFSKIGLKGSPTKVSKTYTKPLTQKSPKQCISEEEVADQIVQLLYPYLGGHKS